MKEAAYLLVVIILAAGWAVETGKTAKARREAAMWHCKFDLIDPIRAEADVPLSDECKELLTGSR